MERGAAHRRVAGAGARLSSTRYFCLAGALKPSPARGKLDGLHSVAINLSYRIPLELLIQDGQIIPVNVGDHDAVYG